MTVTHINGQGIGKYLKMVAYYKNTVTYNWLSIINNQLLPQYSQSCPHQIHNLLKVIGNNSTSVQLLSSLCLNWDKEKSKRTEVELRLNWGWVIVHIRNLDVTDFQKLLRCLLLSLCGTFQSTNFKASLALQTCFGKDSPGGITSINPGSFGGLLHLPSYRAEADESVEKMSEEWEWVTGSVNHEEVEEIQ